VVSGGKPNRIRARTKHSNGGPGGRPYTGSGAISSGSACARVVAGRKAAAIHTDGRDRRHGFEAAVMAKARRAAIPSEGSTGKHQAGFR